MRKQTNDDSAWYENNNHQVMKVEKVNPQEGTLFKRFSRHFFAGLQLLQNATTAKNLSITATLFATRFSNKAQNNSEAFEN